VAHVAEAGFWATSGCNLFGAVSRWRAISWKTLVVKRGNRHCLIVLHVEDGVKPGALQYVKAEMISGQYEIRHR
jgi:hypothetical protein